MNTNLDILSFVKLKYKILTDDSNTWELCNTYPVEVRSKWAWRCAGDVEHLAKGYPEAEECIRVAKAYRDGLASRKELNIANSNSQATYTKASYVGLAFYYTAFAELSSAYNAVYIADAAMSATLSFTVITIDEKWKQYISWLIEELCEYEMKQVAV